MFEEGQIILEQRYRVIKKLGGGAFGEIFKGKQPSQPASFNPVFFIMAVFGYLGCTWGQIMALWANSVRGHLDLLKLGSHRA